MPHKALLAGRERLRQLVNEWPIPFESLLPFLRDFIEQLDEQGLDEEGATEAAVEQGYILAQSELSDSLELIQTAAYRRYGRSVANEFAPLCQRSDFAKIEEYCLQLAQKLEEQEDVFDEVIERLEGSSYRPLFELAAKVIGRLDEVEEDDEPDDDEVEEDEWDQEERQLKERNESSLKKHYGFVGEYYSAFDKKEYSHCLDLCDEMLSLEDEEEEFSSFLDEKGLSDFSELCDLKEFVDCCRLPVYGRIFAQERTMFFGALKSRDFFAAQQILGKWQLFEKDEDDQFDVQSLAERLLFDDFGEALEWAERILHSAKGLVDANKAPWPNLMNEACQLAKISQELSTVFDEGQNFQQMIDLSRRALQIAARWFSLIEEVEDEEDYEDYDEREFFAEQLEVNCSLFDSWIELLIEDLAPESAWFIAQKPAQAKKLINNWANFLQTNKAVEFLLEESLCEEELAAQLRTWAQRAT